jgi:hypothetical protein
MKKNIYVYCTECQYGEKLLIEIKKNGETITPKQCEGCFPWNPEDSFRFKKRPNYIPLVYV